MSLVLRHWDLICHSSFVIPFTVAVSTRNWWYPVATRKIRPLTPALSPEYGGEGEWLSQRHLDGEHRPLPHLALRRHPSPMLLGDPFRDRQPQPRPAFLGGVVDIEDLPELVRRDAGAGVGHFDQGLVSLAAGRQDDLAALLRHRLQRVDHQVEHRLFDEPVIERDDQVPILRPAGLDAQLHPLELRLWVEEIDQLLEELLQVHRPLL